MACQAIATTANSLQALGIKIRPAATPPFVFGEGARRSLHAKFLFSANYRDNSKACGHAWTYLGSGNLTHPGFYNQINPNAGNLEAGVVFAQNSLCWNENKKAQDCLVVTNLLPIQWEEEIGDATSLSAGSGMEQREAIYIAAPVAWLVWHEDEDVRELRTAEQCVTEFVVFDSTGNACSKSHTGILWHESQPRQVRIQWQANRQPLDSLIPVVDQYGRIAATSLPPINIDEAWWQLADFPLPPDDDGHDDMDDENGASDENKGKSYAKRPAIPPASYPIRQMMDLIESIAAKQTGVDEMDWVLWCNRLEQTLGQAADSASVEYFRDKLGLNPLSALRQQAFRPLFAESGESESGKLYEETMVRIEKSWRVNELLPIGGAK
jgi:hypothetical protein